MAVGFLSSAIENVFAEELYVAAPSSTIDAIFSVKALQKALNAGQRIYEVDAGNYSTDGVFKISGGQNGVQGENSSFIDDFFQLASVNRLPKIEG